METTYIIIGALALVVGVVLGKVIFKKNNDKAIQEAEQQAQKIISDAEITAKAKSEDMIIKTKEQVLKMKSTQEKKELEATKRISTHENKNKQRAEDNKRKYKELQKEQNLLKNERQSVEQAKESLKIRKKELDKREEEYVRQLEKVANISADDAKAQLVESMKAEAKTASLSFVKETIEEAKAKANKEAKKIVIQTIQRTAAETAIDNAITVFPLENDNIKGQIIGREGRNIRAIEAATGVELIVDDTPEAIVLSSFDPLRRELARLSLQRLVQDGRIHPAKIEEIVNKTRKQLNEQVMEIGERTAIELGIHGLHKELVKYVGRMRFRSSYGQNLLQHSKETANLCAIMASELGLNPKLAKRAGLLHDIGKVPEDQTELSHALLGAQLAEKYGEKPAVVNAIGAHHDEIEMTYMISPIVQACDAISGARPGARREIFESFIKRIKELEDIAMSFEGVEKAYAISAGRELRILVEPEKISDEEANKISLLIADKIQNEMQYPGQIKITVIRETRAVHVAK